MAGDLHRPTARNGDSFGYNRRGEVVSETIASNAATYSYDSIGNRTRTGTRTYEHNALNELFPTRMLTLSVVSTL